MADTKITALAAITTVDPAADVLPIVDISDTSMAASGTTKKITTNQILGSGGTATLASATISGDLTVNTNVLKVDSTNDRVGIGTASPTDSLHVFGSGNALIEGTAGLYARTNYKVGAKTWQVGYRSGTTQFEIQEDLVERYTIGNGGTPHTWYIGASTAMTLNSTGLGVGGSPSRKLSIVGSGATYANINSGDNTSLVGLLLGGTSTPSAGQVIYDNTANSLALFTVGTSRLLIDSTGNVGIGVTPAGTGGCLQLKSGITFPATQVASSDANTLDDYEEGTFTPTIVGTSTAGVGVYTNNTAKYTKVGNLVTCQIYLAWTAHTGTGDMRIGGLPFATASASGIYYAATIGFASNIALTAGYVITGYALDNSSTVISLQQYPTGGGVSLSVPMDVAGGLIVAISYAT